MLHRLGKLFREAGRSVACRPAESESKDGRVDASRRWSSKIPYSKEMIGVLVAASAMLLAGPAGTRAQDGGGSIIGWGSQVVGVDLSTDFVGVAGGSVHSLGLKPDGSIVAWGGNSSGQCDVPPPNTDFVAVTAGVYHSLGLKADGSIVAWGGNLFGETNVPAPNTEFVAVAAGRRHSLGLKADGSIVAWGSNYDPWGTYVGQCNVPAPNTNFVAVAGGEGHSLGLKADGSIVAWGGNLFGETNVPAPNTEFVAVAAGLRHSLGLKADGSIVAWGRDYGQINVPAPNTDFVAVSGGLGHILGLKADGSIMAWGLNSSGQCDVPPPNTDFVAVTAGVYHSLGLKADGSIVGWGRNSSGQCDVPAPNTEFVAVAGGEGHSLGLKADGSIVAWGANSTGQTDVPAPNEDFVAVAAGGYHSLGVKSDGSIVAWGAGQAGQSYYPHFGQCNVPVPNTNFVAVAAGQYHSLGLKADGSIVAWGSNGTGQTDVPAPNEDFMAVAGGGAHSLGLKAYGSIVAWGWNEYGQCDVPAPNADFVAVAAGRKRSLAIKGFPSSGGDLIVSALDVQGTPVAGRTMHVAWDAQNVDHENAVSVEFVDLVYLSNDAEWGISDAPLAAVPHLDPVGPQEGYHAETDVVLPGVLPGEYHILIRSGTGNVTASDSFVVSIDALALGVEVTGEFTDTETARYYTVAVAEGEDLLISLDDLDNAGANELYLSFEAVPTRSQFDYRYTANFAPDQAIRIPGTAVGTYYILAYGDQIPPAAPASYSLTAEYLPLQVVSITPDHGGNTGQVTVRLVGARFTPETVVHLIGAGGEVHEAIEVYFQGATTLDATFELTGASAGAYDLFVDNNAGATVLLEDTFQAEDGGGPILQPVLTLPSVTRIGRKSVLYAEVTNSGTTDSFVPVSWLRFPEGVRTTLDPNAWPTEEGAILLDFTPRDGNILALSSGTTVRLPIYYQVLTVGWNAVSLDVYDCPLDTGQFAGNQATYTDYGPDYCDRSDPPFMANNCPTANLRDWHKYDCDFHLQALPPLSIVVSSVFLASLYADYPHPNWTFDASTWTAPTDPYFWLWRGSGGWGGTDMAGVSIYTNEPSSWLQVVTVWPSVPGSRAAPHRDGPIGSPYPFYYDTIRGGPTCSEDFDDEPAISLVFAANEAIASASGVVVFAAELEVHSSQWSPGALPRTVTVNSGGLSYGFILTATETGPSGGGGGGTTGTGSNDPNLKIGPSGYGDGGFLTDGTPMPYTILFENLDTATAAAVEVRVTDQLDASLDYSTLTLDEIGFGETVIDVPDGLSHYEGRVEFDGWTFSVTDGWHRGETPLVVDVEAGINIDTGELYWSLKCADPETGNFPTDAYAGFLPPDKDEIAYPHPDNPEMLVYPGEGYLTYSVRPHAGLPTGTEIRNAASIVFDTNDPINTPETLNTIDSGAPTSSVTALPAETIEPSFTVAWTGQDDAGGSGIARYKIYVSIDGGPFTLWRGTRDSSAVYPGQLGHSYGFYSTAVDNVGNHEVQRETADTSITVILPNEPPVITCNEPVALWPPNYKLVDVSSAITVEDPDGDTVALSFRAFSDEPETGDGARRHAPDFKDEHEGGRGLLVRSERRGSEDGRFYVFVVTADDGNGGMTTAVCVAGAVPHDKDNESLNDVLAQATSAASVIQAAVDANDPLPPPGLYEHGLSDPLGPKQ